MALNKHNRDAFGDAIYAAQSRLIPVAETAEARRDALILAGVHVDESVITLLEASRAAVHAGDEEYAIAIDEARRAVGALKAYGIVRGVSK